MCDYCDNDKTIIVKDVVSSGSWGWGGDTKIKEDEAFKYPLGLFVDRGYLRLVDLDDCNCLDAGEKIKINFCPFCGEKL